MTWRRRFIALAALAVAIGPLGCVQSPPDPSSVVYSVGEGNPSGKMVGSCGGGIFDASGAEALSWSVGAEPSVIVSFHRPCGGWFQDPCPPLADVRVAATAPDVFAIASREGTFFVLRALKPGTGGLSVSANGIDFEPLILRAVAPATLSTFTSPDGAPITILALVTGGSAEISVNPFDTGGGHLCGQPPLTVTPSAGLTMEPQLTTDLRANVPLVLRAGATPGSGSVTFAAGGAEAVLEVDVAATGP